MDHRAFQQPVTHQIQQQLQVFAALDHPARQRLARDIDAVMADHFFEPIKRQTVDLFGGQQHRQHAGAGHTLFEQLSRFVSGDRCRFTATAGVDFADVFDHADLHRHDVQLFAGFFADDVFTTAARAAQFVFGQFVDDFNARQVGGQRFAFATALCRGNDFFIRLISGRRREAFGLIKSASCGVCGSTVCSDLRPNKRSRNDLICSFGSTIWPRLLDTDRTSAKAFA